MKKLMIAAFAVAFTVAAQAANCNWNTGALKMVDAEGKWTTTTASSSLIKSIAITTYIYSDSAGENLVGTGTLTTLLPMGGAGGTYKNGTSSAVLTSGATYYAKVLIEADFGNGGKQTFLDNDLYEYKMPSKGTGALNFKILGVIDTSSTSAQWSAVPEPTSGLLLLLGVAGLALRRKQK